MQVILAPQVSSQPAEKLTAQASPNEYAVVPAALNPDQSTKVGTTCASTPITGTTPRQKSLDMGGTNAGSKRRKKEGAGVELAAESNKRKKPKPGGLDEAESAAVKSERLWTNMQEKLQKLKLEDVSYSSFHSSAATYQNTQGTDSDNDPSNTTVFVGGLDPSVTDELLRQTFSPYGELLYVKIPVGKRCGFVQYSNRASAEEAIRVLNGSQLGGQSIRLSWGRSPTNKQPQQEQNQWSSGYYGYPQGYDPYGYARPPQDPAMYAYTAYPGYGNYQQQPPQQPPPQQVKLENQVLSTSFIN
nr:unnamed protein product [Digitaria exilis]